MSIIAAMRRLRDFSLSLCTILMVAGCGTLRFEALTAPVFSLASGNYLGPQTVSLSDGHAGATIYYTTDGTAPTTGSTLYTGPISVASNETIEAMAVASGYANSVVTAASYTITLQAAAIPIFNPPAGTYSSAQSVTISDATVGATVYFTTNGATPTVASAPYTGPISVAATETLAAIAVAPGYGNSAVATASYTIALPAAATPTFTPPAGTYSAAQSITIVDATAGATIYFTTNGTTPTVASAPYTGPISVAANETLKAIAVASGYANSAVAVAIYDIGATNSSQNKWTWMNGSSFPTASGVYGTLGAAAPGNTPGARGGAIPWADPSGNLWLFGGTALSSTSYYLGTLNDLWRFNPITNEWAWISGSTSVNAPGVYGSVGVAAAANVPSSRSGGASWTDQSGNLWMFGGWTQTTAGVVLDDLWEFSPASGQWTWMGGSKTYGNEGSYGTLGVAATGNLPSARDAAASCSDGQGNFWLFGGFNQAPNFGNDGYLNDLWEFNPTTRLWTWMGGSQTYGQPGIYGTQGVPAAGNSPGARIWSTCWTDKGGNIWIFGGIGFDSSSSNQGEMVLNDLWEFNTTTHRWTWMSGSSTRNALGNYGTQGVAAPGNVPSSREEAGGWTDANGDLWLFGGAALSQTQSTPSLINDLWRYNIASGEWTWMAGSNTVWASAVYGTLGVPAASNTPGAKDSFTTWTDSSGQLWLFGGYGYASGGNVGDLNDLWRYTP